MWRRSRSYLSFLLVAPLFLLTPAIALAHAYPTRSVPAPDAQVAQSPTTVEIWFTEHLEPRLSSVVVDNADRKPVQAGPSRVDPHDSTHLIVPLQPNLPKGTYTVVWHAVSADDGHSTAGVFAFGVGEAAQLPAVSAQQLGIAQGQQATPEGVVGRWLTYLATIVIVGTAVFALAIVRSGPRVAGGHAAPWGGARRAAAAIALALIVLLTGQALRLVDELTLAAAAIPALGTTGPSLGVLIFGTRFGALWLARLALLGTGAILVALKPFSPLRSPAPRFSRWFWVGILATGVGLITDLAWSGHAAAGSLLAYASLIQVTIDWAARSNLYLPAVAVLIAIAPALTLAIDWLHLAAVAVWIGGLIALVVLTVDVSLAKAAPITWPDFVRVSPPWSAVQLAATVRRFSSVATIALGVVVLTGLYNTWFYLAGPTSYVTTGYGQSLLLKHVAIGALILAAAVNHFVTVPVLEERASASAEGSAEVCPPARPVPRFGRFFAQHPILSLQLEAGLGLLVLLSTGLLTSLGPARVPTQILSDPARELPLGAEPFQTTLRTNGGQDLRLTISPGRVGVNEYTVRVSQQGQPARDVQRVYLAWTLPELETTASNTIELAPTGPGTFQARGLALSTSGIWQVEALIYRANGVVDTASVMLQATPRWAARVDPAGKQLLSQAVETMMHLHSARLTYAISDGASGMALAEMTFVAPDREETVVPRGGATIQIGTTVYRREAGQSSWTVERNGPTYLWPNDGFSDFQQGVGGIVVGEGSVLGHACTIVAFYVPQFDAVYEAWIGRQDHLIHKYLMAAPSHYMVSLYDDFNGPIQIEPPGNLSGAVPDGQHLLAGV